MSGPVHFIAQLTIDDADRYRDYEKGFFPILKAHGGKFITYDDDVTLLEGKELGVVPSSFDSSRKTHASPGGIRPSTRNSPSIAAPARRRR